MTAHFKAEAAQWQQYIDSHPLGRVGTPEDIVHLAVYLAADESSWVTGSIFTIDGGAPRCKARRTAPSPTEAVVSREAFWYIFLSSYCNVSI